MLALADALAGLAPGSVPWMAPGLGPVQAGALRAALGSVDPGAWRGRRVAIGRLSALELAVTLVYLDGLADAIVMLPLEEGGEARHSRLAHARIHTLIEGKGLGFCDALAAQGVADAPIARPASRATTWLLPTSGTTGTPKLIAHTLASLTRSMPSRTRGSEYRWGSLYGFRRFAGLQVFLQSWLAATTLMLADDDEALSSKLERFAEAGCNALSATPSMWRKLAMLPQFDALQLAQVTLGGEIADQGVLDMLRRRFPDARITHIYASTETGVGFAVRDGLAGFPAAYLQAPAAAAAMRIGAEGHLLFADESGGWLDTGDVVRQIGDRVHFLGRANGSINIGGSKVMPEEVEAVIQELPDVAFVQVRARKSAMLGSLVEAAVSPAGGLPLDDMLKRKIVAHCRARLDGYKVPAFVVAATEIALTSTGKLSRANPE